MCYWLRIRKLRFFVWLLWYFWCLKIIILTFRIRLLNIILLLSRYFPLWLYWASLDLGLQLLNIKAGCLTWIKSRLHSFFKWVLNIRILIITLAKLNINCGGLCLYLWFPQLAWLAFPRLCFLYCCLNYFFCWLIRFSKFLLIFRKLNRLHCSYWKFRISLNYFPWILTC